MKKIDAIYCDFDGTITKEDSVNAFFEMYAPPSWMDSEKLWIEGKISSRENAIIQVGLLKNVSQKQLDDYINSIEVDDYFLEFVEFVKSKNIKLTILSDGFDLFIQKVLERYNLDIPYYANKLIYKENSFCYIGDGTSDLCIASKADFLFASKNLHKFCKENNIKHSHFTSFRNIIDVLKEGIV